MKKLLFAILVIFLTYKVHERMTLLNRDKLIGTWKTERDYKGVAVKKIMDLKPTGDVSVEVDGSYGVRIVSKDAFGTWQSTRRALSITFTRSEIPVYLNGKKYGGEILALDDKTLSYRSDEGIETWNRIR